MFITTGAYGKEPIRTLEELVRKAWFMNCHCFPVDHPGQEQKSQWLQIRRERPDYILFWGWGVMNQVAIQEAANIRFPMENFIGVWWSGSENDVLPAGDESQRLQIIATFQGVGSNSQSLTMIQKYVVDTGKAAGVGDQIGTVFTTAVYVQCDFVASEALDAQEMNGNIKTFLKQ